MDAHVCREPPFSRPSSFRRPSVSFLGLRLFLGDIRHRGERTWKGAFQDAVGCPGSADSVIDLLVRK